MGIHGKARERLAESRLTRHSNIAGNVFGLAALRNLRLKDVEIPEILVKSFRGPKGIDGV